MPQISCIPLNTECRRRHTIVIGIERLVSWATGSRHADCSNVAQRQAVPPARGTRFFQANCRGVTPRFLSEGMDTENLMPVEYVMHVRFSSYDF